jgi:hypothetical protein
MAALGLLSGEVGRRSKSAVTPNARIMVRRLRDVRQREARLLSERLDTDRLELGLVGVAVRVQESGNHFVLFGPQDSVIANLSPFGSTGESLFTCEGPGMGLLVYTLIR